MISLLLSLVFSAHAGPIVRVAPKTAPSRVLGRPALRQPQALAPRAGLALLARPVAFRALPVPDQGPIPSRPAKHGFAEFARLAEQAFYQGKLSDGQHGSVAALNRPRVQPEGTLPEPGEMQRRMELPTLSNPQREQVLLSLLKESGWGPKVVKLKSGESPDLNDKTGTIWMQDAGRGRHNIWVITPGRDPNKIIVSGAHHDKVAVGEGKIDNWGGAAMIANISQETRGKALQATHVHIMFSREEEGLIGSDFWVRSLSPADRKRIKAMVNVDTVGVGPAMSWKNNSSRYLLDMIMRVAKRLGLELQESVLHGGDSDSSSFKFAKYMTVFGCPLDQIWDILHSERDTLAVFNLKHYVDTTKIVLATLYELDAADIPQNIDGDRPISLAGLN